MDSHRRIHGNPKNGLILVIPEAIHARQHLVRAESGAGR
jgi:hypothetical protein